MKVKKLKEMLGKYNDDLEITCFGASGMPWKINEEQTVSKMLIDEEKKNCKIYIE